MVNAVREVANFFMPTFRKYTIVLLPSPSNIVPQPYLEWRTYCPVFSFMIRPRSSLIVSSAVVPVSAAPTTLPRKARALWASLVDSQRSALEGLTIQAPDRPLQVLAFGQFDEAESPRLTRFLVSNYQR